MQWIEVCIKTTSQAIELVGERLTMLGFDSFIMDDQDEFHEFLENNKQYWDYGRGSGKTDAGLEPDPALPRRLPCRTGDDLLSQRSAAAASAAVSFHRIWNADVSLEHVKDEDWRTTGSSTISRSRSARSFWSSGVAAPGKPRASRGGAAGPRHDLRHRRARFDADVHGRA